MLCAGTNQQEIVTKPLIMFKRGSPGTTSWGSQAQLFLLCCVLGGELLVFTSTLPGLAA